MVCCSVLLGVLVTIYLLQSRPVYLVDFHCYRAPDRWVAWVRRLWMAQCKQQATKLAPSAALLLASNCGPEMKQVAACRHRLHPQWL